MIDRNFALDLVARFGSPLYAYDLTEVERRVRVLFSVLPASARVFYSFKANPLPAMAEAARAAGCCGEIASLGELNAAQDAGFSPEQLLFGGPGKTEKQIQAALATGITRFSCESLTDLRRIHAATTRRSSSAEVLLRVNPAHAPQARLTMTGVESQFGFDEGILLRQAEEIKSLSRGINLLGVHVYFGTQIGVDTLAATTRAVLETSERVSQALGFKCSVVDAGGGFPWPYASAENGSDLSVLQPDYAALVSENAFAGSVELWFESGRYIAAAAGTLLATVLDVKESRGGKKYIVLDTGIHHLGGMSGLGRIPRPFVSIVPLTTRDDGEWDTADVVGPLCSPLDSLGRSLKVPRLKAGDVIAIPNVGAYGLSASLIGFLSHPPPKEITFRDKQGVEAYELRWGHRKI